jgi:hypothetical protein
MDPVIRNGEGLGLANSETLYKRPFDLAIILVAHLFPLLLPLWVLLWVLVPLLI